MDDLDSIAYIRRVLRNAAGDDLERAEAAFMGMTPEQLNQQDGCSGKSRRRVLQDYRAARLKHEAAVALFEKIIGEYLG